MRGNAESWVGASTRRPLTGHSIGRVLQDTSDNERPLSGDELQAQRLQGARYALVS